MLSEAITTSAIEGETLDRESVRSSLLNLIGLESVNSSSDQKAEGAAALMVDVREKWDQPLTHELLGDWQTLNLKPNEETAMAKNQVQFQRGLSLLEFLKHYRSDLLQSHRRRSSE